MTANLHGVLGDTIHYSKHIRAVTGTVTAAILYHRLEYWCHCQGNGFYKFLEPCEHRLCKDGDSWIEELGFSLDEFRSAFNQIGIRYKSSTAYEEAEQAGTVYVRDGSEYPYCSVYDRRTGLTHYYRNDTKADMMNNLILKAVNTDPKTGVRHERKASGKSQFLEIGSNEEASGKSQFLQMDNPDFSKSEMSRSYKGTVFTSEPTTEKRREEKEPAATLPVDDFDMNKEAGNILSQDEEVAVKIVELYQRLSNRSFNPLYHPLTLEQAQMISAGKISFEELRARLALFINQQAGESRLKPYSYFHQVLLSQLEQKSRPCDAPPGTPIERSLIVRPGARRSRDRIVLDPERIYRESLNTHTTHTNKHGGNKDG